MISATSPARVGWRRRAAAALALLLSFGLAGVAAAPPALAATGTAEVTIAGGGADFYFANVEAMFIGRVSPVERSLGWPTGSVRVISHEPGSPTEETELFVQDGGGWFSSWAHPTQPGVRQVTVEYSGDETFAPKTQVLDYRVPPGPVTKTTLTSSHVGPVAVGQQITLTTNTTDDEGRALEGYGARGSVVFFDNGVRIGEEVEVTEGTTAGKTLVASQTATFSTAGNHSITALFQPGSLFYYESTSDALVISVAPTLVRAAVQINAGTEYETFAGEGTDLSGAVSPVDPALGSPTGSVRVISHEPGNPVSEVTLLPDPVPGYFRTALPPTAEPGIHEVTVEYSGDATFAPKSELIRYRVLVGPLTKTTLSASPSGTVAIGQRVTFTANTTDDAGRTLDGVGGNGQITFFDNGKALGEPIEAAQGDTPGRTLFATFTASFPSAGKHTITAHFVPASPDYSESTSGPVVVTVAGAATSTPTPPAAVGGSFVVTPRSTVKVGHAVRGVVEIHSRASGAAVSGSVQFYDGTVKVGQPVALVKGFREVRGTQGRSARAQGQVPGQQRLRRSVYQERDHHRAQVTGRVLTRPCRTCDGL